MSVATTLPVVIVPDDSAGIAVPAGNVWSAWVELSAATPAPWTLTAIRMQRFSAYSEFEVEVGVGAAGLEAPVTAIKANYGNIGIPNLSQWNPPITGLVATGVRVSVRARCVGGGVGTTNVAVAVIQGTFDSDHVTTVPTAYSSPGVAGVALPCNTTAWAPGAWAELLVESVPVGLLSIDGWIGKAVDWEIDLGAGAAGTEAVITTLKGRAGGTTSNHGQMLLPGAYLLAANTRVAIRVRKSGTDATGFSAFSTTYYANFNPAPVIPTEDEFDPDVDISGQTIGLWHMELVDADGTRHTLSKQAQQDHRDFYDGYKEERVVRWGDVERGLSDSRGHHEGTTFSIQLSDTDWYMRRLLAGATTRYLLNRHVVIRAISDAARRAANARLRAGQPLTSQQLARTIVRGVVRQPKPQAGMLFELVCEDTLTPHFKVGNEERQIPRRKLPAALHAGMLEEAIGLAEPIIYGELSDQAFETRAVPSALPFGDDIPPVTSLFCHDVIGAGTFTGRVWAMVCAVIGGEEGPHSNMAGTYMSAPSQRRLAIFWDEVPGADSYNVYVFNGSPWPDLRGNLNGSTVVRVKTHDTATHDGLWHGLQVADYRVDFDGWADGADALATTTELVDIGHGVVKPIYVGRRTLGGVEYHMWVVAGHAGKATIELYIDGVPQRIATDATQAGAGGIWLIPGFAGWTAVMGAALCEDIDGRRYWTMYGKVGYYGPDRGAGIATDAPGSESATTDQTGLSLNVQGAEDVGDGTGALITAIADIYLHFLTNFGFGDYQSGAWLDVPSFPADPSPEDSDTIRQIDADSFAAVKAIAESRLVGGYVGAGMFGAHGEFSTLSEAEKRLNVSLGADSGFNRRTQYMVDMLDETADLSTARHYLDQRDIFTKTPRRPGESGGSAAQGESSFEIEDLDSEHFNVRPFACVRDYARDRWVVEDEERDEASITNYQEAKIAPPLELWFVRAAAVQDDLVQRALEWTTEPPRRARWKTGLVGLSDDLGACALVTHPDGVGPSGWEANPVRIVRHRTSPEEDSVTLTVYDISRIRADAS